MSDFEERRVPPAELTALAAALQRLAPQPATLSRDALLFAAGRAAAAPSLPIWVWQATSAVSVAAALVLSLLLAFRTELAPEGRRIVDIAVPADRTPERTERPPGPLGPEPSPGPLSSEASPSPLTSQPSARPLGRETWPPPLSSEPPASPVAAAELARVLRLRRDVLRWGLDVLPPTQADDAHGPATLDDLAAWLNIPPGTLPAWTGLPRRRPMENDQ